MTRVLVVGDTHGDARWFHEVIRRHAGVVDRIIQVGDFGWIFPQPARERGLDKLNRQLDLAGIDLVFLPGNHEDHPRLAELRRICPRNVDGHVIIRPRIAYTGRYSAWTWGSFRLGAVGGAVSIDRDWRVQKAARSSHGTKYWWPEEVLSPEELAAARTLGKVDYLFTHDAPSSLPWPLKQDLDSTAHRQAMTEVGRALQPRWWFHGHYHHFEEYDFYHSGGRADVISLGANVSHRLRATRVIDLT